MATNHLLAQIQLYDKGKKCIAETKCDETPKEQENPITVLRHIY